MTAARVEHVQYVLSKGGLRLLRCLFLSGCTAHCCLLLLTVEAVCGCCAATTEASSLFNIFRPCLCCCLAGAVISIDDGHEELLSLVRRLVEVLKQLSKVTADRCAVKFGNMCAACCAAPRCVRIMCRRTRLPWASFCTLLFLVSPVKLLRPTLPHPLQPSCCRALRPAAMHKQNAARVLYDLSLARHKRFKLLRSTADECALRVEAAGVIRDKYTG